VTTMRTPTTSNPSIHVRIFAAKGQHSTTGSSTTSFGFNFETLITRLERLPRMFTEPDGSIVWTGEHDGQPWQLDGQITDHDGAVAFVEMNGRFPIVAMDEFLRQLQWPDQPLVFEDVLHGRWLSEAEMRERLTT